MASPQHTVAIHQVHSLLQGLRHQGGDVSATLLRAGIAPALLDAPLARVSQRQFAALMRALRRQMRDELWGLLESPLVPGSLGQCLKPLVSCATLEQALRQGFAWLHGQQLQGRHGLVPRLQVQGRVASIVFVQRGESNERVNHAVKTAMLVTFNAASWLVARRIPLQGVDYVDRADPVAPNLLGVTSASETSRVYQVPVRYGQAQAALHFDAQWLALPVVQSSQSLREFLHAAPGNLIIRYRDTSRVSDRLRRLMRKQVGAEGPTLETMSTVLGMSAQTLRRRLRDEGHGYQDLKDQTRRDVAIELLLHTTLAIPDIAGKVGFSEASSFHRAFKQWTGVAPGAYRLHHATP